MNSAQLIASISEFSAERNIDKPTITRMLSEAMRELLKKKFDQTEGFDIVINPNKGDLQIWRSRQIVPDEAADTAAPGTISLSEARKIEADFEVGEEVSEEIPRSLFSRRDIVNVLKQFMMQSKEQQQQQVYDIYRKRVGQLIQAEVYHTSRHGAMLYDQERNELTLPRDKEMLRDRFEPGQQVLAVIDQVTFDQGRTQILLSRTSPLLIERLMESEIPEVLDRLVRIQKVVRAPGERAKVVVSTEEDRIDPVGACIGVRGTRIRNIMRQLQGEQIDVINHTDDINLYIQRALSPAKIHLIQHYETHIDLYLPPEQIALAIGQRGHNIRLASQLIGKTLHVHREPDPADSATPLAHYSPSIAPHVLQELHKLGLHTRQDVLQHTAQELATRSQLDTATLEALYHLLDPQPTPTNAPS